MTPTGGPPGRFAATRGWWMRHRRPALVAGAMGAAGLSALWFRVLPDAADTAVGWQAAALRYGHGGCWALLAASLLLGSVDGPPRLRAGLGWAALASYAGFLLGLVAA